MSAIAVGVILVLVAGWVAWSLVAGEDGPSHPDEWDPRVVHLVEYVEDHGGRPFEHPVHIHFLPDDEFKEEVTSDETELTEDDLESIAQAEAQMRALGLVDGDFDLFEGQNELQASGILAYYDPDSKSVTVRGTELTLAVEVTVVHELVHAWQDQLVDLTEVEDSLEDDAFLTYRAVVEGHAVMVEQDYVADELDEAEREEYFATGDEEAEAVIDDAPAVLVAMMSAPYALGPYFVGVVAEAEGNRAVIDLLSEPPASLEQLFDPRLFLDGVEPVEVDVMELPDGAESIDEGSFEILELYLVLASRLDAAEALDAADG